MDFARIQGLSLFIIHYSLFIKPKVLPTLFQINTVANWGSTGRIAEGIGEAAMQAGWQCWMAYGRGEPKSRMHLVRVGDRWGMYGNAAVARLFDNEGLNARSATRCLIEVMRRVKPDVVHLHNLHGYYLNFPLLFSYLAEAGVPVVWTLHDCWPLTGHCTNFDFAGCDRWKTGCHNCPQLREYPAALPLRDRSRRNWQLKRSCFTLPRRLTLVPVSDWLAGLVRQSFLGRHEVYRIYNGVDLQQFRPMAGSAARVRQHFGIRAPRFVLGVASTWTRRKGLQDFIKLRSLLSQEEYDIVLLGLSPQQIKHLPAGLLGLQRTDSVEELAQLYSAASVFANPTWEDNFPTTNIEALACGTPVVTYRTGGSIEAVDEETGLIVERGNVSALAEAVKQLSHQSAATLRPACRRRAEELYNKEARYEEYVHLYENLLAENYK